ncbi:MAG: hypothetical protein RLZZ46_618 [Bacteroidota bacterium]
MQQFNSLEESHTVSVLAQDLVERTQFNIFLTGKAGTGKTTFLRNLTVRNFKPMLVCAPTGIAALNAGGVTLHSMMGIPPCTYIPGALPSTLPYGLRVENPSSLVKNLSLSSVKRMQICRATLMVIDEVSMLRADMLDAIDQILKFVRRSREPFGGMQMLFIGDLMQLPPVIKNEEWKLLSQYYRSPYFFDAKVLVEQAPLRIELTKVYRQKDEDFAALLNRMRSQQLTASDVELLNRYYVPGYSHKALQGIVTLTTHNRVADTINQEALQSLNSAQIQLSATVQGEFPESMFPCERELKIKPGAQVMFIKNDLEQPSRFFNGKMGVVEGFQDGDLVIRTEGDIKVKLEPHLWENVRYTIDSATGVPVAETIGSFLQYPLRLAWAITIHKSQGLTFERAAIDVQNVFASGQCYVAFSRLRSLKGLTLITPFNNKELNTDSNLLNFESQPSQAERYFSDIKEHKKVYFIKSIEKTVSFSLLRQSFTKASQQSNSMRNLMTVVESEVLGGMNDLTVRGRELVSECYLNTNIPTDSALAWVQSVRVWLKKSLQELVTMHQRIPEPTAFWKQFASELENGMSELWMDLCFIQSLAIESQKFETEPILREWVAYKVNLNSSVQIGNKIEKKKAKDRSAKKSVIPTRSITLQLLREGKSMQDIAVERKLTEGTIGTHIAGLIAEGQLRIEEVLSNTRISELSEIIMHKPSEESLWSYHQRAHSETAFSEFKWVEAHLEKQV